MGPVTNMEVLNFTKSKAAITEFKKADGRGQLKFKYVIIGAGNAAGYAAHAFVESGQLKAGELCIIGSENVLPYERPTLTKAVMKGKADIPMINTCGMIRKRHEQEWYDDNGICMVLGTTVENVDLPNKVIKTKDGEIQYEKCLAATGARPIYLHNVEEEKEQLKGIFYIRSYQEAKALRARLEEAKSEEKVVLVGGGYIGTEMAGCLSELSFKDVKMVVSGDYVIKRIFPPEFAKIYEDAIEKNGTALLKRKRVKGFEGSGGNVTTVILDDGEKLEASIVIVGVGSRPNVELFQDQVEMEMRGIKVDGQMKSSVDSFYVCGDIATFHIKCQGEMKRLEHVSVAKKTAMQAARAMLGIKQDDIDLVPYFYSKIFDLNWDMFGKKSEKTVLFGFGPDNAVEDIFGCVWVDNENRLMGVLVKGASKNKSNFENLVRQHAVVKADLLAEGASTSLKAFLLGQS